MAAQPYDCFALRIRQGIAVFCAFDPTFIITDGYGGVFQ